MAGEKSKYQNINVEIEDAFGVENAAPVWLELEPLGGTITANLMEEALADDTVVIDLGEQQPISGSKAGSTLGFSTHATGLGTAAGDGVTPTRTPIGTVLLGLMGTEVIIAGDTIAAVTDAGEFTLTTQAAVTKSGRIAIGVEMGATHGLQIRTGTLTAGSVVLDYYLPAPPQVGDVVRGSITYQAADALVEANSFQAQYVTATANQTYISLGMLLNSLTLDFSARQMWTAALECVMADWETEVAALSDVTLTAKAPWMGAHAILVPVGTSAYAAGYNRTIKGQCQATFARGLVARDDQDASQGLSMWDSPGEPFFAITPTLAVDDLPDLSTEWRDNFGLVNGKTYHGLFASRRVAGSIFGLGFTKVHQNAYRELGEQNGIMTAQISLALATAYDEPGVFLFQM